MRFPLEGEVLAERARLLETLRDLSDDEFHDGQTLCDEWAPRDVLGHLIGIDSPGTYLRHPGIGRANAVQVSQARELSRDELMARGEEWAARPSATGRLGGWYLIGDLAIHHQDIVRGLGRSREVPPPVAAAIFRQGAVFSAVLNRRIFRYRIVPTDGGRPMGRGREVRGTREALGMWLAGRDTVSDYLDFAPLGASAAT
jgi:uncharacterized protein (TIGR03083 family)